MSVESACTEDKPIQCSADKCGQFDFCDLGEEGLNCPPTQPYCSVGLTGDFCSAKMDGTNPVCTAAPENEFECTSVGYFPDPYSCTKYHLCFTGAEGSLQHKPDECAVGKYYNSKSKACLSLTSPSTQCRTLQCSSANAGFYVYPQDEQFYYTCLEKTSEEGSTSYEIDMFRCPQGETYVTDRSCWYKCPGINLYPHENKQKYYDCQQVNGKYTVETCPSGTFNPVTKVCDLQF